MKPITTNVFTFEKLITGGSLYVDKTEQIFGLVKVNSGQFFLSRPRRFGKSLLVSTLKALFQGKRELFKGLEIYDEDYDWRAYPVIHLDMGSSQANDVESLNRKLIYDLKQNAVDNNLDVRCLPENGDASDVFKALVHALAASASEGKVVILIDEYDKPLLGHIGKPEVAAIRDVLKAFYSVVKTTESKQRFAFITGVSKFSKVSIFSDLNNLTDLTMSASAATLLGYTDEEVRANFAGYITELGKANGMSEEETFHLLKRMYDGFRFEENSRTVFNPVSVGKCFIEKKFDNYWFETGTPTFLLELLKKNPLDLGGLLAPKEVFSVYEVENPAILPLLVQTGYLTIKDSYLEGRKRIYRLDYPNLEIADSFNEWLVASFSENSPDVQSGMLLTIIRSLRVGDVDAMIESMKYFFSCMPSSIVVQQEKYYQSLFYAIFKLVGASIDAEVSTNIGRIDAVIKTDQYIYVTEFKLRGTAEDAMRQIHERKYYEKYLRDGREITLLGVAFDKNERNITQYLMEKIRA